MTGFRNDLNQNVEAIIDESGILCTMDHAHYKVHNGELYEIHYESINLDTATPLTILIQTGSKTVHLFYELAVLGARVDFQIFRGPTITAESEDDEIIPSNLNEKLAGSAVALTSKFYATFTATADGTEITQAKKLLLGFAGGVSRVNATVRQSAERVLAANTKYLLRATSAADNAVFTFDGIMYEV